MPIQQLCTITEKNQVGADTYWYTLSCGKMVARTFRGPGQFVHIACGEGSLLRRPISVAACGVDEPQDLLGIAFQVRGKGTAWLAQRQVGETLDVLGLMGNGFRMGPGGHYLLVGGGIGVPPLYGCAKQAQFGGGTTTAVLGFRDAGRAVLLEQLSSACNDVRLYTDDGSLGACGYVHEGVRSVLDKDRSFTSILACGPKPMLRGVVQVAREYGIPCQVSMEERMACGVGACLGCAVAMADGSVKRVCKDGPVFLAEEVDWNA